MEKRITGAEPIYPVTAEPIASDGYGLTIRQHFAAMAMQGICQNPSHIGGYLSAAQEAVKQADALINELNKE